MTEANPEFMRMAIALASEGASTGQLLLKTEKLLQLETTRLPLQTTQQHMLKLLPFERFAKLAINRLRTLY